MVYKDTMTFIKLLRYSLSLEDYKFFHNEVNNINWIQMFEYAYRNNLVTLLYPVIKKIFEKHNISNDLLYIWKKISIRDSIYEQRKHYALRELLMNAEKDHVDFIVLKGFILADLYPKYQQRTSCDTDLYINKHQKDKAVNILDKLGYRLSEKSKDEVGVYINEFHNHTIEMHTCLWEDYSGPKISILESLNITDTKSLIKLNVCGINVISLGYTEHLIFQLFHIIKHFSLECVTIRYLIDITLYVNKYFDFIQLDLLWSGLKKMGYDVFCLAIFRLCIKYFDMNSDIVISDIKLSDDKLNVLLNEFITNSQLFKEKKGKWELMGDMIPYFIGEKQGYEKEAKIIMRLFPTQDRLLDKYRLGKTHKILLPLSWIHRMFDLIIAERTTKIGEYTHYERALAVNHKLKIMESFGLLNEENNNA